MALSACLPDQVCDPGYSEDDGLCFKKGSSPKPDAATGEDDEDAGDGDAATTPAYDYSHFGDTCSSDAACKAPAPTCLGPLKYCSRTQCADDEKVCPPGFVCMDISKASPDPSVTHICFKQ